MFPNVVFGTEGDQRKAGTTQQHDLGVEMWLPDGRKFRYAKNGATAAAAGKLYQSKAPGANFDELAINSASALTAGSREIKLTNGVTAITADLFKEGYMNVEDDTGEGHAYVIEANDAESAGSAAFTVTLKDPNGLKEAIVAATTVGLTESPFDAVIVHPSPPTTSLVGVAASDIAASSYGWFQFKGICSVLGDGTLVVGRNCMASDLIDGAVEVAALAEGAPNTQADFVHVGVVREVAADTEYSLVFLNLP